MKNEKGDREVENVCVCVCVCPQNRQLINRGYLLGDLRTGSLNSVPGLNAKWKRDAYKARM